MDIMDIDYSTLLLEFRAEMNWSQTELAKRVGVSQGMISAIELKERNPSRAVEHKIHEALKKHGLTIAHFTYKHNPVIRERIAYLVDGAGGCESVAELLGVSVDDVLAWKRGTKTLEGPAYDKMIEVFKVAPEWLDGIFDDPDADVGEIGTPTGGRRIRLVEERVDVLRKSLGIETDGHWEDREYIEPDGHWTKGGIIGDIYRKLEKLGGIEGQVKILRESLGVDTDGYFTEDSIVGNIGSKVDKLEWFTGVNDNNAYTPRGESLTTEEQGIVEVYRALSTPDKFDFIGVVNEYRGRLGSGSKSQEKVRTASTGTQQLSA